MYSLLYMRKPLITLFAIFLLFGKSQAQEDTILVSAQQNAHWNWYGNIDQWAEFPGDTVSYRKILLYYTLGCPSTGCSEWDYTTSIQVRHRNGEMDSTLSTSPWYQLSSSIPDSLNVSVAQPWVTFYDGSGTDSVLYEADSVFVIGDPQNPTQVTDTVLLYQGHYWNYYFDAMGNTTDSILVAYDSTWMNGSYQYYTSFEKIVPIELARFITPYNGTVPNSWSRTIVFDVTDYATILRDSVEIRAHYAGWQDGFTISLDFHLIEGIPARSPVSVQHLYNGSHSYGTATSIENFLVPDTVSIPMNAVSAELIMTPTGHGFGDQENCAEFCPKDYYVKVNGNTEYTQLMWKDDCGWNPQFPQSGTWLYDRANWCPGDRGIRYRHDLTPFLTPGSDLPINVDFEPYTTNGSGGTPSYTVDAHVISYGAPNFQHDAELIDILSPNNNYEYSRFNPICATAKVILRNGGSSPLTSVMFEYGVEGGQTEIYQWNGSLGLLDTAVVELPIPGPSFWYGNANRFHVSVNEPNGVTDEQLANNQLSSEYELVNSYESPMVFTLRTNNAPLENSVEIVDASGNIVWNRGYTLPSTAHNDTIVLPPGCYTLHVHDSDKDGLSFFANNDGTGYIRIKKSNGIIEHNLNPNFGAGHIHAFTIGYNMDIAQSGVTPSVTVIPNPTPGFTQVSVTGIYGESSFRLYNINGGLLWEGEVMIRNEGIVSVSLEDYPAGVYLLHMEHSDGKIVKRIIRQ